MTEEYLEKCGYKLVFYILSVFICFRVSRTLGMSAMHAVCMRFTVKVLRRKFGNKRHVVIDGNRM